MCFNGAGKYSYIYVFTVKPLGMSKVKVWFDEFHMLRLGANLCGRAINLISIVLLCSLQNGV
jgi:hypothetical protein